MNTFGKATAKANRALPNSPRKRKMVVTKLYEKFVAVENEEAKNPVENESSSSAESSSSLTLSQEIINKVTKFYELEEMSRQAPGSKDAVIIRDANGTKSKIQARHLFFQFKKCIGSSGKKILTEKLEKVNFLSSAQSMSC